MSVIWYKVWSDLWDNKIRTLLAVVSISVGVFAVGATFGMTDQMLSNMDIAHRASVPAHFTIALTKNITKDIARRLEKNKDIDISIATGSMKFINYKINPEDEWDMGWMVMREDYTKQKYELFSLKGGEWPKGNRIGIERLSSQYYEINIDDKVIFEVNNRSKTRKINGKLRHNFVPPPEFGGPAVFFTDSEGMQLFGIPKGEFNRIFVRVSPYSKELARQAASNIKDRLSKEGIGVAITIFQNPDEHWGRFFMEGINMVLQVMAVVSLAASMMLVLNTLMGIIAQQTNQIGIMKAIGGTQNHIVKIYLVAVLVYGSLSLVIALPAGAILAFGATQYFLNIFNIDYEQFQYSNRAFMFQFFAAIAVPLLAALPPILKGTSITVREAISSYGLSGNFGQNKLDRIVEQFGQRFLSGPYAAALGNMFRGKGRLILTQSVLILAGTMFLAVMSLSASINLTLDNVFTKRKHDFKILFDGNERVDRLIKIANDNTGIDYAEVWFTHGASILKEGQRLKDAGFGAELVGIPNSSDIFRPPILTDGRWLHPDDGAAVVIRKNVADDNNIKVGDTIIIDVGELGDSKWQVVGFYQNIFSDIADTDPIFANLNAVFNATKQYNRGTQIRVQTVRHNENYAKAVLLQLKQSYETKNIDISESITLIELRHNVDNQFSITITMLLILAVIMAVVGGIGLMGALSISVVERTREIGVMRAIGAKTITILGMFMMEGILQGLVSWIIVIPLSFALGKPMANALGMILFDASLNYKYNFFAVFVWLITVIVISTLASIIPARSATLISVSDSLAYS